MMKVLNTIILASIASVLFLFSCGGDEKEVPKKKQAETVKTKIKQEKPKEKVKEEKPKGPLPEIEAEISEIIGSVDEPLYSPCSHPGYNLTASSVKKNWEKTTFGIDNITDNDRKTAWVEGSAGYGIGEYIEFKYDFNDTLRRCKDYCQYFTILNGYQKSRFTWRKYSRVKKFKVYADDKALCYLNLQDHYGLQFFMLNFLKGRRNGTVKLRFEIVDIYPGNKKINKATAVSELFFSCSP